MPLRSQIDQELELYYLACVLDDTLHTSYNGNVLKMVVSPGTKRVMRASACCEKTMLAVTPASTGPNLKVAFSVMGLLKNPLRNRLGHIMFVSLTYLTADTRLQVTDDKPPRKLVWADRVERATVCL